MRSRSGVFFSFLFPVLLLLVFATVFSGTGGSRFALHIQNLDHTLEGVPSELSSSFLKALNGTGAFDLKVVPRAAEAKRFVQDQLGPFGGTFRLLIIPQGFQRDILNGSLRTRLEVTATTARIFLEQAGSTISRDRRSEMEQGLKQLEGIKEQLPYRNVTLVYVADPSNLGSSIAQSMIDSFARTFSHRIVGVESNVQVKPEGVTERRFSGIDYYLPGLIAAFVMTNGVIGVTSNATEFKRRGILKRLATTPLSRLEWILGNVMSQTMLSLILVAVMVGVAWLAFGLRALPDPLTLIIVSCAAVMFSGMGLILAGLVTDVEAATAAGNAIAFPMMFLSGAFWPLEIMPSYLQTVARALPLTYVSEGLRASLIYQHLPSALTNMAIVSILAVVFIVIGSMVTKWKEY